MTQNSGDDRPVRYANGRFGPGNPGRPFGSRNRMSERVATAILRHFEDNQDYVLGAMKVHERPAYARLIAGLLPKAGAPAAGPDLADYSPEEVRRVVFEARAALDRIEGGHGDLNELEAALHPAEPEEGEEEEVEYAEYEEEYR